MRPLNIVYMHSHDTGRYIQPYGHAVNTPHLQRLAERGVLFRQAFCAGPTCSPSRASLLTGQSPHGCGMLGLAHRGHRLNDYHDHIIHTLHGHGYMSALCGFQHIAARPAAQREDIGYHQIIETDSRERCAATAAEFLRGRHDQPFFLDVGFTLTHRTRVTEHGVAWHNQGASPLGDPRYVGPPEGLPDTAETRRDFADFAVCAHRLDAMMGRVLDAIDEAGLAESTLVIVTTDHGIAYPGHKCTLTDRGTGVMLMLRGPSDLGLADGRVIDGMVSHIDLFPTICELIGIDPPARLEGRSVMPLIRGETDQVNDAVFAEVTHHAAYEPKRAVRTKRYKYIRRFDEAFDRPVRPNVDDSVSKALWADHGWAEHRCCDEYLFDLMFDPHEANNLADSADHAEVLEAMRGRLGAWMQATDDPILLGSLAELPGIIYTPRDAPSPRADSVHVPRG